MKANILYLCAFVALCISTCNAVFGVLYANSGAAGVNWNPNLLDPIQGNDYFSQPGNETSHNYFSSTADISTYNTITVEFWSNVVGIGAYTYSLNPQIPFFYGNQNSYIALALPNGLYARANQQGPYVSLITSSGNASCTTSSGVKSESLVHISFVLAPGAGNSIIRVRSFDPVIYPNVWSDTCVATFTAPMLPTDVTGATKEIKFGSHSFSNNNFKDFAGQIDEVKIWNVAKTTTQLDNGATNVLNGNEAGLVAYYRMNSQVSFLSDTSINANDAISSADPPVWIDPSIAIDSQSFAFYAPVWNVYREIPTTQNTTIPFMHAPIPSGALPAYIQLTSPPSSRLQVCVGTGSTCNAPTSATPLTTFFTLALYPSRGACGTTETFTFQVNTQTVNIVSYNPSTVTLKVIGTNATLSTATFPLTLATTGGNLVFPGTALGRDEVLAAAESASLVRRGGNTEVIQCVAPYVGLGGTRLYCGVNAGVGQFDLQVTLCGQQATYPLAFSYTAPTVTSIGGNDFTSITIDGTNFGPSRTWTSPYDRIHVSNATDNFECTVVSNNHTSITCSTPSGVLFTDQALYNLNVTIGGQSFYSSQRFTLCNPGCKNNGTCQSDKSCDCSRTGYEGVDCSSVLVCSPDCVHGVCIRGNDQEKQCSCDSGWTASDCSRTVDGTDYTPAIAGGSAAGGVIVIALVIAVIILATRKPKRGTKNFIPVEKKDFTKIIYGEQLNQSPEKNVGDLKALEQLLIQDNLELAFAISNITQITEADKIAKAMVVVFEENKKVPHLLEAFISDEVRNTEQAGTLFRSNSMVSKMFKFYSRLIGLPYLYTTIGPEIDELIFEELGLEVDPEKMEEGADLDEMRWTLMAQSQKILKTILNTVENCPAQFRSLFAHIKKSVSERFPDNVNTTIGGFIFLRFFCPAVSSPEAYGIVEEPPSASARRLLILITKVLQNLSNDVEFGSKEPYMTKMNDFIQSNRAKLVTFYDKLVKPSTKSPVTVDMPKNIKPVSLAVLSAHIRENINKFENQELKKKLQEITKEN